MTPGTSAAARTHAAPVVERRPLYFGPRDAALFGWYHAPASGGWRSPMAMAICPPLGHEYINTHRSLRHLADRLAAAGVPALRFDYQGTGDSSGSEHDPHRLLSWLESIQLAARRLRAESGCDAIGLAGLRMGATLAAVASHELDLASLVLWAPCLRGRTYLRELRALQLLAGGAGSDQPDPLDAGGFLATAETQADIARLDLEARPPRARRILIGARDDMPEDLGLRARWTAAGLAVDRRELPGYADMMVVPHHTAVPHMALTEIVTWVVAASGRDTRTTARSAPPVSIPTDLLLGDVRESTLRFGPGGSLFGIVTEPVRPSERRLPTIVLSNAGSAHHVAPNRLYVQAARRLARAGFRCVRVDLPGLGDSASGDASAENLPYPPDSSRTIDAAIEAMLTQTDGGTAIVMGLCSGAHAAFHAALDLEHSPIVESVLINPLTFAYAPGMSLDGPPSQHVTRWQRYRRSLGSLRGWSKLLRRDTDLLRIASDVVERARILARNRIREFRQRRDGEPRTLTRLERDLTRLAERNRRLTFVFSRFDPGHDLLTIQAGPLVKSLRRSGRIQMAVIDRANHTFDQHGPRTEMLDTLVRLLKRRYGVR